jgi:hypothetical protein
MKYGNPENAIVILKRYAIGAFGFVLVGAYVFYYPGIGLFSSGASISGTSSAEPLKEKISETVKEKTVTNSDAVVLYNKKMTHLINGDLSGRWTAKGDVPLDGAIFPYKRVIAFYGNLYSKQMGILGELPKAEVLKKLEEEVAVWRKADPVMEVQPALHYIAVTAQCEPGKGGTYRMRMPFSQIDSVLDMAKQIDAIVFLDIQIGLSALQNEIPELEKYLKLPNVHLGIDPEFSMKGGEKPGSVIGTFDASDINYAADYLTKLVKDNNLPPKILIVHRFTQGMVKEYKQIKTRPEVQMVMHMDGWGVPAKKITAYNQFIYKEPVEYTGLKLFYKNDTKNSGRLLTPQELLNLKPRPVYIQYQ